MIAGIRARPTAERGDVVNWAVGFIAKNRLQSGAGSESKGKAGPPGLGSPKALKEAENDSMRPLLALLALLASVDCARAQWSIFAEKLPAAGQWATYDIARTKPGEPTTHSTIRLSVRDGGMLREKPAIWLTVEPVTWLGSREKGALRFLLPKDLSREGANRLLESAAEVLFTDPKKGPWHMTPEDVASLASKAGYQNTNTLSPDELAEETIPVGGTPRRCQRLKMESFTIVDPPFVTKQTIILRGIVWRDDTQPFGVMQAKWSEKSIKGDKVATEEKVLTLTAQGKDETPPPPLDHGEEFSMWRLIFKR